MLEFQCDLNSFMCSFGERERVIFKYTHSFGGSCTLLVFIIFSLKTINND